MRVDFARLVRRALPLMVLILAACGGGAGPGGGSSSGSPAGTWLLTTVNGVNVTAANSLLVVDASTYTIVTANTTAFGPACNEFGTWSLSGSTLTTTPIAGSTCGSTASTETLSVSGNTMTTTSATNGTMVYQKQAANTVTAGAMLGTWQLMAVDQAGTVSTSAAGSVLTVGVAIYSVSLPTCSESGAWAISGNTLTFAPAAGSTCGSPATYSSTGSFNAPLMTLTQGTQVQIWKQTSTTAPTSPVPTGVVATPGNGQVNLTWNAVTGATSYNVYASTAAGVTPVAANLIGNVTGAGALVTGVTNGTTYYFVITAVTSAGESAASAEVSATPSAAGPGPAPTGVVATPGNGQVSLSWTAVTGATSYNVYYSTATGVTPATGTLVTSASAGATISGLANGTTYYFVVTAVTSGVESAASTQVSAAPYDPAVPQNLLLVRNAGYIRICLTDVSGTAGGSYNVYRSTAPGTAIAAANLVNFGGMIWSQGLPSCLAGQWSNDDYNSLVKGATYYYKATSVINGVESAPSTEVSITY